MKVLWVKGGKLLPVDTGGKIRSYNILRRLAKDHDLTLLSYYGGRRDPSYEAALAQQFPQAQVVYTAAPDSEGLRGVLDYLYRLPRLAPYSVSKFTHPAVRKLVRRQLSGGQFDVAICDFLAPSLNFPKKLPIPCVLFQHNVESLLWQRMATTESHPLRKLSYTLEAARMSRYERRTLAQFHHVIAVSEHDRQQMLQMLRTKTDPACEITVVPTGVDTAAVSGCTAVDGYASSDRVYGFDGLGAEHRCGGIFLWADLAAHSGGVSGRNFSDCRTESLHQSAASCFAVGTGNRNGVFGYGLSSRRNRSGGAVAHRRRNAAQDL